MEKICLVVPCYNEALRLQPDVFLSCEKYDFIFVNDGSTDNTRELIEEMSVEKHISCCSLSENFGKAKAVSVGMKKALQVQNYKWIGYWDADLATPLDAVEQFIHYLDYVEQGNSEFDVLMGSRVRKMGSNIERKWIRHILGRCIMTLCSFFIAPFNYYDTQCGAKLFKNTPQLEAALSNDFRTKWLFDIEFLLRLSELKAKAIEIPLQNWVDVKGSKISLAKDGMKIFIDLFYLFFCRRVGS